MILGQLLEGKANGTATYYSPWFPRGGNLAKFTCQVFAYSSDVVSPTFSITVETKNSEDSDASKVTLGSLESITLATLALTTWERGANLSSVSAGFKELVRFKYQVGGGEDPGPDPWVHIRVLNPVWLSN